MRQNFTITDNINNQKWDDFVNFHAQGNIFQTTAMLEVFRKAQGYRPYRFGAIDHQGKIIGVLLGAIIQEKPGFIGRLGARAIIQGGPLVRGDDPVIARKLIEAFDEVVKDRAVWGEIHNLTAVDFQLKDYRREDHLDFIIDLEQSEEDLWTKIRPSRRQNIRRGGKLNVLEEAKTQSQIKVFYELLQDTYQRANIFLSDLSLFQAVFEHLAKTHQAKIFLSKHNHVYTGGRLILIYGKTLYDWYAGAKTAELETCPNDFLVWEILKWGRREGYKTFDFGGAGRPNEPYGPREFKRQFGGQLVNFGWPTKIYSPWQYYLAHWGLKMYQWLFSQIKGGKS